MFKHNNFTSDQKLGRQFGLGADPGRLSQAQTTALTSASLMQNFSSLAVIEYVTQTFALPLLDSTIATTLGDEVDLMTAPKQVIGAASVDSSWAINGLSQTDIFVVGVGAHVFAEPDSATVLGNQIQGVVPAFNAGGISPDAYAGYDMVNTGTPPLNPLGLNTAAGDTIHPALLEWGSPAWQAMWHMVNAYQFEWTVCNRFNVIQEMLSDFCYFGSYADAQGMSDSQIAGQRLARRTNDTYQNLGNIGAFMPIHHQRIGVTTATAPFSGTGAPVIATGVPRSVFKPTRAYDEVNVTWGGISCQNQGSNSPFRKLQKAVLIERGSPIAMGLTAQDSYHYNEMRRYLSISDGTSGTIANVSYASGAGGYTIANNATNELSLDTVPVLVTYTVDTNRILLKGGALCMSVLLKGFEVCNSWRGQCQGIVNSGFAVSASQGGQGWGG